MNIYPYLYIYIHTQTYIQTGLIKQKRILIIFKFFFFLSLVEGDPKVPLFYSNETKV